MASITTRENSKGQKAYIVQIRVAGSKSITKLFYDHVQARQFADQEERRIREQVKRFHIPDPAKFYKEKFTDVIDLYLAEATRSKKHIATLAIVKRHIGTVSMGELRTTWVKGYVEKLKKQQTYRGTPYEPATIAVHLSVMATVYKWRTEEYDLDLVRLPFSSKHLGKGWDKHRERRLDAKEEEALISVIQSMRTAKQWQALLTFALETAARQQELIYATWSEISHGGKLWVIPATHTKTKKTRRVPLTDRAIAALDLVLDSKTVEPSERIFSFLSNPSSACSAFRKIARQAALKDFRFHDLRHEAISRMVLYWTQYNVFEIMQIVGHSSTEMLNRYANLRGEELVQKMRSAGKA